MSFSCRTQPPVMTLVPTYIFVGNLFQAFVMYARVGLHGSRRFGLVLTGTSLCLARNRRHAACSLICSKFKMYTQYRDETKYASEDI